MTGMVEKNNKSEVNLEDVIKQILSFVTQVSDRSERNAKMCEVEDNIESSMRYSQRVNDLNQVKKMIRELMGVSGTS